MAVAEPGVLALIERSRVASVFSLPISPENSRKSPEEKRFHFAVGSFFFFPIHPSTLT